MDPGLRASLELPGVRPRSMATGEFDGDGVPDVVVGYATPSGGLLVLFPANRHSLFPHTAEAAALRARGELQPGPLLAPSASIELPVAPELLVAGDVDGDHVADIVAAQIGRGKFYVVPGTGRGTWGTPRPVELPGSVTALAGGELRLADGVLDLIVGLAVSRGGALAVFASELGIPASSPEFVELSEPPTNVVLGMFDDDRTADVAIAGAGAVRVLHGSERGPGVFSRPEALEDSAGSLALAAGRWTTDRRAPMDIILLLADGTTRIYGASLDEKRRPRWQSRVELSDGGAGRGAVHSLALSGGFREDLLAFDATERKLTLFRGATLGDSPRPSAVLEVRAGDPVSVTALRLNDDAQNDLVVLLDGRPAPVVLPSRPAATWVVDSAAPDTPDWDPGDGWCFDSELRCTLRAAVQEAAASAGADSIVFDLGPGVPTIILSSTLETSSSVTIDGATGGATRVRLTDGANVATGLSLGSAVLLRSLVIDGFSYAGIAIEGQLTQNRVEDCYIGTDAQGGTSVPGNGVGIRMSGIWNGPNTIGGTAVAQRNVISNNLGDGIRIGLEATFNPIEGNFIGTNPAGTIAVPNGGSGIYVVDDGDLLAGGNASTPGVPPGNLISGNLRYGIEIHGATGVSINSNLIGTAAGGTVALGNGKSGIGLSYASHVNQIARNVLSGNTEHGLEISNFPDSTVQVAGNLIGTSIDGQAPLGNLRNGLSVAGPFPSSSKLVVGTSGTPPAGSCVFPCNRIAFNGEAGVRVDGVSSSRVTIRGNSISSNQGLGIDLGFVGPTANDALDADVGPNGLQNFPLLESAAFNGTYTAIAGSLDSNPNTSFTIDVYETASFDPTGYGEGGGWLTSTAVTTDATGHAVFNLQAAGEERFLTATATDSSGRTSEFSRGLSSLGEARNVRVFASPGQPIDLTYDPACDALDHAVYYALADAGPLSGPPAWTGTACGLGITGVAQFDPGPVADGQLLVFVVVGQTAHAEGAYGATSAGPDRPEATGVGTCDRPRSLGYDCD